MNKKLFRRLLFGKPVPFPNSVKDKFENLPHEGLPMGTVILGAQGSGKTTFLGGHIVEYSILHPKRAIFILDWSGAISDTFIELVLNLPEKQRERLMKRIVYDEMGNSEWVVPLPEFSEDYGSTYEEQAQRVSENLRKLNPDLSTRTPYLGGLSLSEIATQIFRLLTAIVNEHDETWQLTEAKRVLYDQKLLEKMVKKYGHRVGEAKWYFEKVILPGGFQERQKKFYSLVSTLGAIESKPVRARIGYYRPGWTPKEAIEKGLIVIIDGASLINQKKAQHYLFTQVYSLIMAEINKRRPNDPRDLPVSLVMDEVKALLETEGMADEIKDLSPIYRSRKLQVYIVIQALSQLASDLRENIWTIGNAVCFELKNVNEAEDVARQFFVYQKDAIKLPARSDKGQPIVEYDKGQYLEIANKIQRLKFRECIIRRQLSERELDPYIRYIPETKERPVNSNLRDYIDETKDYLLQKRGIRVTDALDVINKRKSKPKRPTLNN